jgi:protein-S-isoprenylcysteine O-methyltransferase Ste14
MDTDILFRIEFWALIGLVLVMRIFFIAKVRTAGERLIPDDAAVEREGRGAFLVRVFGFLFVIGLLVSFALNPPWISALAAPFPAWLRAAGFAVGLCGLALWIWSQIALGTLWSANLMLRKTHTLITSGPYAAIRHPLYVGMIGWSVGLALVAANWILVAVAAVVSSVFVLRVPKEEQMLLEKFGVEYREYIRRTGSFFPKL